MHTPAHLRCGKGSPWWPSQRFPAASPGSGPKPKPSNLQTSQLHLPQGQVMTPDILCPEMTPSSRKNVFLGQTCTGISRDSLTRQRALCVWYWGSLPRVCTSVSPTGPDRRPSGRKGARASGWGRGCCSLPLNS